MEHCIMYAGPCPFGYGACFHCGGLCTGEPVEGSAGCGYTRCPGQSWNCSQCWMNKELED
jgi:hypothetical protein